MTIIVLAGLAAAAYVASILLCRVFIARALLPDVPQARSSHTEIRSRAGGLAILIAFLGAAGAAFLVLPASDAVPGMGPLVMASGLIGLVGLADDVMGLAAPVKLLAQIVVAAAYAGLAGPLESLPIPLVGDVSLGAAGYAVGVIWIVVFLNVFNFMDGINGIATGCALVCLAAVFQDAVISDAYPTAGFCLLLGAAILGFFRNNFPNGRIFLGDAGSLSIGFFLAGLALVGPRGAAAPFDAQWAVPVIAVPVIFLPFILDTGVTLLLRLKARENVLEAHKSHFYQRLTQAGQSHATVTKAYIVACLACALACWPILMLPAPLQGFGVIALAGALVLAARWYGRRAGLGVPETPSDSGSGDPLD